MPFYLFVFCFGGKGSPTKVDYRRKGSLIRTSLLEGLRKFRANVLMSSLIRGSKGLLQALEIRFSPVFYLKHGSAHNFCASEM